VSLHANETFISVYVDAQFRLFVIW